MGKALFAAICGAVLGGAILIGLGKSGIDALWPALGVGLLCGLCMRVLAKQEGGSYLNGALAAIALLAAVVGGKFALVSVLTDPTAIRELEAQPVVAQKPIEDPAAEAPDAEDPAEEGDTEEPVPEPAPAPAINTKPAMVSAPQGVEYSPTDGIFLVLSALIAYQVGKGEGGKRAEPQEPEAEPALPEEGQPQE